jgi:hypothetical protein
VDTGKSAVGRSQDIKIAGRCGCGWPQRLPLRNRLLRLISVLTFRISLDLGVDIDERSLESVNQALKGLQAENIFVPPLETAALSRGHSCHFRYHALEAEGLRIDSQQRLVKK